MPFYLLLKLLCPKFVLVFFIKKKEALYRNIELLFLV